MLRLWSSEELITFDVWTFEKLPSACWAVSPVGVVTCSRASIQAHNQYYSAEGMEPTATKTTSVLHSQQKWAVLGFNKWMNGNVITFKHWRGFHSGQKRATYSTVLWTYGGNRWRKNKLEGKMDSWIKEHQPLQYSTWAETKPATTCWEAQWYKS